MPLWSATLILGLAMGWISLGVVILVIQWDDFKNAKYHARRKNIGSIL